MAMIDKLNLLMEKKGVNKSQLSKDSDIPYTTIDGFFKKGTDNVKLSTLKKLSEYFGCTLDYLVDDEIDSPNVDDSNSSFILQELLSILDELTPTTQQCLLNIANELLATQNKLLRHNSE